MYSNPYGQPSYPQQQPSQQPLYPPQAQQPAYGQPAQQQPYGAYPAAPSAPYQQQPSQPPTSSPISPPAPTTYGQPSYAQQPTSYQQQPNQAPVAAAVAQQDTQSQPTTFDTQHGDLIHDAQYDYYGRKLATASSDRTVRIFSVDPETPNGVPKLEASLTGHEGPVWQVAWSHPKFGSLLATASFDGSVIIWKQQQGDDRSVSSASKQRWVRVKEHRQHDASVNAVAWAPYEYGLKLACAGGDGRVSVLSCAVESGGSGDWETVQFHAHQVGCNAVSWCPAHIASVIPTEAGQQQQLQPLCLATAGCDNLVKVWKWSEGERAFHQEGPSLSGHQDWVRDVAWCPAVNAAGQWIIASASQDRSVLLWSKAAAGEDSEWTSHPLSKDPFAEVVWRVSWSVNGGLLAVSGGDNRVTLWRAVAGSSDAYELVSTVDQSSL